MKQEHMNPDDAVRAHLDLESATSIAIHHSTVRLTDEAIDAPTQAHREALQRHDVPPDRFRLIEAGETLSVP
jgi:L-ascorbate metabolism protein UlaG (beta-lactamase superfamily)